MNIKTAVVAGFILNVGLGGAVFAQSGYYPPASRGYAVSNQWQAERIVRQAYRDILGREPDASSLAQYTRSMLYDHWTEADVRRSLQSSQEYAQRGLGYGNNGRYGTYGAYRRYDNRDIRRSSWGLLQRPGRGHGPAGVSEHPGPRARRGRLPRIHRPRGPGRMDPA